MTVIKYKINNQTGRNLETNDWISAQTLQQQIQTEELAQFKFWSIFAHITNNNGSTMQCWVNTNGQPFFLDENGNEVIYVDETTTTPPLEVPTE